MRLAFGALLLLGCGRFGFDANDPSSGDAGTDALDVSTALSVATGNDHSCGIVFGNLYCWGSNSVGQLGVGDMNDRLMATSVPGQWVQVVVGDRHTCALSPTGEVSCWGENTIGQLATGDQQPHATPMPVSLPRPARKLASTHGHVCAILDDTSLACWGANGENQLGNARNADELVPIFYPAAWQDIATGDGHSMALRDGELVGSGRNTSTQICLGTGGGQQVTRWTVVDPGPWSALTTGQNLSCGIRPDASLWCCGTNAIGELGTGDTTPHSTLTIIDASRSWHYVDVDTFGGCGLFTGASGPGALACWGRNVEGQLGFGDNLAHPTPQQSGSVEDWVGVAHGRFHTCAQRADGSLWCAGAADLGKLGQGDVNRRNAWSQVALP